MLGRHRSNEVIITSGVAVACAAEVEQIVHVSDALLDPASHSGR